MSKQQTKEKPQNEKLDPKILKIALILVFGALAPQFDSTMVNVAIETLTRELNSTVSAVQWVITGYVLTMGLSVPVSGWAVNRFGGKRVYLFALTAFLVSSILCSLAWNVGSLIGFRLLQGVGAGLLIPTLQTVLVQITGGRNLGRLVSIIGIPVLLGPILGPVLGGLIIDGLSWHWIFYVNIPITGIALLLAWRGIPTDTPSKDKRQPLDLLGLLMLSPAFALLIYGISRISRHGGMNSSDVLVPLTISLLLLAAFIVYALRTKHAPVLDLRLFKSRNFLASNITVFLLGMVMNGAFLLLPLFYQQVRGETIIHTGLLLIPQGIGMLLTRASVGKLADRLGARPIVMASLALAMVGMLPFTFADQDTNWLLLAGGQLIFGAALNGILIPIMVSVYDGLKKEMIPHASVSTRIFQTIGGAFGSAVLATVIDHQLNRKAASSVASLAQAYNAAFWWAIGFAVIAGIASLFLSSRRKGII
ncbi:MDR family MFS transporter [Gorillibacterium massiliense]|uniref:MDR family MFS transporter n=1 Tax=Gorillibacterium massiliense TaxID=1280390 RepID=UPI0004BCE531|nr:MDR family MFS transporter [Gorillibacterium massiliense]